MTTNFYDKLAVKLGGYGFANDGVEYRAEYPEGNPEEEFFAAVSQSASKSSIALDIGCGDGIFSFRVANMFLHIDGIDNSEELIKIAQQKQSEFNAKNVSFLFGDAMHMPYENESYDVAFNRRGPSFYGEFSRVLKPSGIYIEIGIGEQDARSLKEAFRRGQDFNEWTTRRIERDSVKFGASGLHIVRAEDYFYKEFYTSRTMFETFLEGVPIFEDFDRINDAKLLDDYCSEHMNNNGEVALDRHRVLYVLEKR